MKSTGKEKSLKYILMFVSRFSLYFLIIAFILTCCMMLFLKAMSDTGISYKRENIEYAAKITFVNVLVLTFVVTLSDFVYRYRALTKPLKKIKSALDKVSEGDFSVRIDKRGIDVFDMSGFSNVIDPINRMIEELSGIETLRTDFIANVSHEMKSPLAVMQNYAMLLQQPNLSEEKRIEYSRTIAEAARGLADMVTNILKLNKLENQKIYTAAEVYNLGEQLCECFLTFENAWEKKGLDIETDIDEDVFVKADRELLSLVWNNLLSNAVKFTKSGGRVFVSVKKDGVRAVVKVSDTGCGISPEIGKHIFEKFYQGDTSHASKGNGLGLALVKRVIDIVGGDVNVSSTVGKGSTFTVVLGGEENEA